tara:strand:+ start:310 stop:438 length:129 start_codon:yes stop_codon:yes gene_type:complete
MAEGRFGNAIFSKVTTFFAAHQLLYGGQRGTVVPKPKPKEFT